MMQQLSQRWELQGRTISGVRMASLMVGPGERLPDLRDKPIGSTITVAGNVWTRVENPNPPIVAVEQE